MNCKLNCLIITFLIQAIYAFSQNNLPKGSLIVAKDGSGNYKTIQQAIDALSNSASSERVVFIKSGTYNEQVSIKKHFVTLIGENKDKVIITKDLNNAKTGSSAECATVKVQANNFKAFDITFQNTAPFPGNNAQAPAFYSLGNNHFFQNCNFLSYQDTLLSYQGTQYFKKCYIRGVTDFIWGFGRAVFDGCVIHAVNKGAKDAYITANGNEDGNFKAGGFLIVNSQVKVDSGINYYLGRLWKKNCYVIFANTELPGSQLKNPGWLTFSGYDNYKNTSKVGEYKCFGANYSPNGRASFATNFSSVPSIAEFLGGNISYASDSVYFKNNASGGYSNAASSSAASYNNYQSNNKSNNNNNKSNNNNNNKSNNSNCSSLWAQCGGSGFNGPKCCKQGTCKVINQWYSQCQ
ncbi:pectin lyase-like protein [Neocallimastix lanati (nom. inval.)]|jgi:pectinesterase|uniref:pectinesterase n=1 Tax=Neocallimastix californiae TaxID=1754190 RepID=A0A1Y2D4P6_9FUNG|nr:pectin lyase-like protein [Neocallimastix sp. JGI-2020a]ORY54187.1 pectin lyase-like protein [Neocallimastix californiae]|eukprot:ORY54187.1 pectin lyase-like protein [Neocallimastix californiae]